MSGYYDIIDCPQVLYKSPSSPTWFLYRDYRARAGNSEAPFQTILYDRGDSVYGFLCSMIEDTVGG